MTTPQGMLELADLPSPETMLTYASILEKQQYVVKNGVRFPIPTGEIVEAACAALRVCARQAAAPQGREALDIDALREKLPRYVSDLAREIAGEAEYDLQDEHREAKNYTLARWFDAVIAALTPAVAPDGAGELRQKITRLTNEFIAPDYVPEETEKFVDEILSYIAPQVDSGREEIARETLEQWADDFEAAAHEVPKGIKSTILMTRAQEVRKILGEGI